MTADGRNVALSVPWTVQRFNRLKVGDQVSATYNNAVTVRLKPPGEPAIADTAVRLPSIRDRTSGTHESVRRLTATIVAIDKNASSVSFDGPDGWKYTRHVVDPAVFDQIKVGDRVDVTWSTELTIALNNR